jgi:Tfp pilus assembly protein PilF
MESPFLSSEEFDERAFELYETGAYEQAIDLLRQGLSLYPQAADLHVALGYVRAAREEFMWAQACFRQAVALDPQHEDGWVGLGDTLLRLGRADEARDCFTQVDLLGFGDDAEFGMTIGRALYREGYLDEAKARFEGVLMRTPSFEDALVALAYTCYAAGDDARAARLLREVLVKVPELHDARVQLSHLRYESGDVAGALEELERVPLAEVWDPYVAWRYVELRAQADQPDQADDAVLSAWKERLAFLEANADPVDAVLAEVEAAAAGEEGGQPRAGAWHSDEPGLTRHRIRTADGLVFSGTWEEIVAGMRDALSGPDEPLDVFMQKTARQARVLTGRDLPCDDPERFLRESARIGLLRIEPEDA